MQHKARIYHDNNSSGLNAPQNTQKRSFECFGLKNKALQALLEGWVRKTRRLKCLPWRFATCQNFLPKTFLPILVFKICP